jgi:hypothetical protein
MFGPPLPHKFPSYLPNVSWDLMQKRSIAGSSQFPQLWQVFIIYTCKHLQDTSHHITGDILVGFSEGVGQGLHLHFDPVQHTPDSPTCTQKFKALPTKLANGFFQLVVETVQFRAEQLAKSLSFLVLSLLQITFSFRSIVNIDSKSP